MKRPFAGTLSDLERVLIDSSTIQRRVAELAAEIQNDFRGQVLSVVALMDGALFFVADLLRHLELPVQLHTLTVSSYHGGVTSSGRVQLARQLPFTLKTRHVLLIDDILDTGLTLSNVQQRLQEEFEPEVFQSAVLLDKQRARSLDVKCKYTGFKIEDEFVVGYGMDYQGHYRNLPCIGVLNPDHLS